MDPMKAGGRIDLGQCGFVLHWSVQARAKHEGQPSGDGYTILRQADRLLFAVADGSGSGAEAARAVSHCLSSVESASDQLESEFRRCHEQLRGGRGAALAVVSVDVESGVMTWAAVGDVDGILMREREGKRVRYAGILQISGTLGVSFSGVALKSHLLQPGDTLAMTTDGVARNYIVGARMYRTAEEIAARTLQDYGSRTDDCLVLAIAVVAG